jgi:hypothetical protein
MSGLRVQAGKLTAGVLCVLLIAFTTAEAVHSHPSSGTLHHSFCYWCFTAHSATVPTAAVLPPYFEFARELVLPRELRERALLMVPLEPVRPPPPSKQKDLSQ